MYIPISMFAVPFECGEVPSSVMFLLLINLQFGPLHLSLNLMALEGSCQVLVGPLGGWGGTSSLVFLLLFCKIMYKSKGIVYNILLRMMESCTVIGCFGYVLSILNRWSRSYCEALGG